MDCRILIAENDLLSWIRVGGSELQFFATDDEVAEFLIHGVPQEYAPYQLYTFSRVEVARKKFLDYTEAFPPDEFLSKVNARRDQRLDMFFIRSQILTPTFQVERERTANTEGLLSLNGFISLQNGFVHGSGFFQGKQSESRVSVIKGVHNVDNGVEIQNDG